MSSTMSDCCRRAIENYKSNNSHLACALNEQREQSRMARDDFMRKCREFQEKCDENVQLKAELERKEAQLEMWKETVREVVKNNTSGLGRLIGLFASQPQLIGATSSNNGVKAEQSSSTTPPNAAKTEAVPKLEQTLSASKKILRRKSMFAEKRNDLPHLTEECQDRRSPPQKRRASVDSSPSASDSSIASDSPAASSSPEISISPRRTLRRRTSVSPTSSISSSSTPQSSPSPQSSPATPPTPPLVRRRVRQNSVDSALVLIAQKAPQNDNAKKTAGKGRTVPEKENNMVNGGRHNNGRPRRKAAPADLKEEKLNIKMRRNQ